MEMGEEIDRIPAEIWHFVDIADLTNSDTILLYPSLRARTGSGICDPDMKTVQENKKARKRG